jgi:hypothetical protein
MQHVLYSTLLHCQHATTLKSAACAHINVPEHHPRNGPSPSKSFLLISSQMKIKAQRCDQTRASCWPTCFTCACIARPKYKDILLETRPELYAQARARRFASEKAGFLLGVCGRLIKAALSLSFTHTHTHTHTTSHTSKY